MKKKLIFECEHCEDGREFEEKDLEIDPGNEYYECPLCGCQFFNVKRKRETEI